jgi:ubiquinone/menaquinone biosynthesis C-methylase UbiE
MDAQLEQIREQQKATWNKFSPGWKKWDGFNMAFLQPMGDAIIDYLQIKNEDNVLDIATGTGEPGLTIASLAKKGKVTGTDLSEDMLSHAAANAAARGIKNYDTLVADVCELPFADNSFDAISCRMGFMFFPDMELAAREMLRVLKPGGRMATSVWGAADKNFWVRAIMEVLSKNMEMPKPPPGAPGMFRCGKPGLMAELLAHAGFKNISQKDIAGQLDYGSADKYWQNMTEVAAPVVGAMSRADETTRATIKKEVYEALAPETGPGTLSLDYAAIVLYGEAGA